MKTSQEHGKVKYIKPDILSGLVVPYFVLDNPKLSGDAKLLYARMVRLAKSTGYAYPKHEALADMCDASVPSVKRWLAELHSAQLIESKRTGRACHYRLVFPADMEEPGVDEVEPAAASLFAQNRAIREIKTELSDSSKMSYRFNNVLKKEKNIADVKAFIEWFSREYEERTGNPYKVSQPKDSAVVKSLLALYGRERLEELAVQMLTTKDQWLLNTGLSLSILSSQANKLALQSKKGAKSDAENLPPKFQ